MHGKETTLRTSFADNSEEDQHTIELSSLLKEWRGRLQATALLIHSYPVCSDKELPFPLKTVSPFVLLGAAIPGAV
jgi:hypothetical protein